jgi:ribose/xylose/arabinose/galactoside ABC-type transport system permease subunit
MAAEAALMSTTPTTAPVIETDEPTQLQRVARYLVNHPHIVLIGVLIVLIFVTGAIEPNYLSVSGLRNSALFAVPIGVLAAGQTILMLTGGIDLSAAMIAPGPPM